jgi:hypothetical protein
MYVLNYAATNAGLLGARSLSVPRPLAGGSETQWDADPL